MSNIADNKKIRSHLKDLFERKSYSKIILEIENISAENERDSFLHNLYGACKALNPNRNEKDLLVALDNFKNAYLKGKNTLQGLHSLENYANVSIELENHTNSYDFFLNSVKFYEEVEKQNTYNEKLVGAISKVYKRLLNVKKRIETLKKTIDQGTQNKLFWCSYIYTNNFSYNWKQIDYYKFSEKFKNFSKKYEIKKNKNFIKFDFKKPRIGFVSGSVNPNHSTNYFLESLLKNIDIKNIDIYFFSLTDLKEENNFDIKIKKYFKKWINISELNLENSIKVIQKNKINILIDLMGVTGPNKIELFQNRVSPIQILWLGYNNTVGLKNLDYLILDTNLIKQNEEEMYHEEIIKLKDIWNSHIGFDFKRKKNESPYKRNKYITFCSFNNYLKISDDVVETWSEILKKVPNSKLLLKSSTKFNKKSILKKFNKLNLDDSLIVLDHCKSHEDHLMQYKEADLALDTFPYTGVTTSFEALWMNVPVLTMKGFNSNSRCGESINLNANIEFFIAKDKEEYIDKAIYISKNLEKLDHYRDKLFNEILSSPLFNTNKFADEFLNKLDYIFNKHKN